MAIGVGENAIVFTDGSGKRIALPLTSPVVGDNVARIPTLGGQAVAVPLASPVPDDTVLTAIDSSGKRIVLKAKTIPETQLTDIKYLGNNILITCGINTKILYRSPDLGITWTRTPLINLGIGKTFMKFLSLGGGVVLAGTLSTVAGVMEIWKSINYGLSWTKTATLTTIGDYAECCNLTQDVSEPSTIYTLAYLDGSLWKSTNSGDSWIKIHDFYLDSPVKYNQWGAFATNTDGTIFVGLTELVGGGHYVYQSSDGGTTWSLSLDHVATERKVWLRDTHNPDYLLEVDYETAGYGQVNVVNWEIGTVNRIVMAGLGEGWKGQVRDIVFVPDYDPDAPGDIGWFVMATTTYVYVNQNQSPSSGLTLKKTVVAATIGGLCNMTHFTYFMTIANEIWKTIDKGHNWTLVKAL